MYCNEIFRIISFDIEAMFPSMHGSRRVHIDKSFVLIYEIDEKEKIIRILDYDHHDKIY